MLIGSFDHMCQYSGFSPGNHNAVKFKMVFKNDHSSNLLFLMSILCTYVASLWVLFGADSCAKGRSLSTFQKLPISVLCNVMNVYQSASLGGEML